MRQETLALHAGWKVDSETGALAPPLVLSTTFARDEDGDPRQGRIYGRDSTPNRDAFERAMAVLEGGEVAMAFASGMAATTAVLHLLRPGDHVVAPAVCYYNLHNALNEIAVPWGVTWSAIGSYTADAVRSAIRPETRVVWIETPANPTLGICDIAAVAEVAHAAGALVVCDSTMATPLLQQPITHGADIVLHSATKSIGGHSDLIGGVLVCARNDATAERLRRVQKIGGGVMSPFDSWLALRGLATLPVRMRACCESALAIAAKLAEHPRVEKVHYPMLPSHPDHEVALRQMQGGGCVLSFEVVGGAESAIEVAARLQLITRATSFGGLHTTIEHRASVEPPDTPTPPGLLRLSVGLEHVDDLLDDLLEVGLGD